MHSKNNTMIAKGRIQLEHVASQTYLGSRITADGGTKEDVLERERIGHVQQYQEDENTLNVKSSQLCG